MSNEGFTSSGENREYPHISADELQTGDYLTWPQSALERLDEQYAGFIQDPTSFPPHVERARRIRAHVVFELSSRVLENMTELDSGK